MKIFRKPSVLLAFVALMLPVAFAAETIVNTATIIDPATNDRGVISRELGFLSGGNLQLIKTVERSTINIGESVRFDITLTNPRDTAATGLELIDLFDEQFFSLETGTLTPAECYGDASRIRCLFSRLEPGEAKTISYRLKAKQAGASANVVTVAEVGRATLSDDSLVVIADPGAPFQLTKTPSKASVMVGEEITYTAAISNTSTTQAVQNLVITDDFPENLLQIISVSGTSGLTCQNDASKITCTLPTLGVGQSGSFTAVYRALAVGTATNTLNASDSLNRSGGASADVIITDSGNPFLVTKTPNKTVMKIGEEVHFIVSVRNRSANQILSNVVLTDDFPEEFLQILEVVPQTGFACQRDASRIRCNVPSLAPGETRVFSSRYLAIKDGTATNTVNVTHQNGEEAAESASVIIQDTTDPFLLTKTPDRGTLTIGENVTYTITLASRLPGQTLQNVTLTDDYAESKLEFLEALPGNGLTCQNANGQVTCSIANFTAANTYSLQIRYRAIDDGAIGNRVTAKDNAGHVSSVAADVIVLATNSPFILSKQPDKSTIDVGEDVNYTVNLTARADMGNRGFVTLVDDYPEDLLRIRSVVTSPGISCVYDANEIRCSIVNPVPGRTYSIASRFTSLAPGTAENTATLTGDDGAVLGLTEADVIILDPGNPFLITKRPNKEVLEIGENVEFTVTVTNRTNKDILQNVDILDDFDETSLEILDLASSAGLPCQSDVSRIGCNIQQFTPGQTVTFTARYKAITPGAPTNTVTVTEENGPTDTASAKVTVLEPGSAFYITKHANKSQIEVGEAVSYTVSVTNRLKANTLRDVTIVDNYPEDTLKITDIKASWGLNCQRDAAEIRCRIPELTPGATVYFTAHYEAIKAGTTKNQVTVGADNGQGGEASSSLEIIEPKLREVRLTSDCEGRSVLIGQQCLLTVVAIYLYQDEKVVSAEAKYFNFENIGTMGGNLLTTTKEGIASLSASFGGKTSNAITITVVKDLAAATSPDGKVIRHFPARVTGGLPDTVVYGDVMPLGSETAGTAVTGKHDRLIFKAIGGAAGFTWTLGDKSFGTLTDFHTGQACPVTGNSIRCAATATVLFQSAKREGTVSLTLADSESRKRDFTIHVLKPVTETLEISDTEGRSASGAISLPQQENVKFSCKEILSDGTVHDHVEGQVEWEFRFNGGTWTKGSDAGSIGGGILTPTRSGTYAIRAKRVQKVGFPGIDSLTQNNEEVLSSEVTVQIGDPIPYIDSIRLDGNLGIAEGTTPTLFLRLRHFGTIADIGDIEIDLVKGKFTSPEAIPADVQHFKIELVPNQLLSQNAGKKTVLLEIPILIPILDDLRDGPHTIRVYVNNQSGLPGRNIAVGVLPVYVGMPQSGDADLSGTIDLADAVLSSRFVAGTVIPDSLQLLAIDADHSGMLSLRDFVEIFQAFLSSFLK